MSDLAPVNVQHLTASAELEALRPLWLALHHHHREVQSATPLQPDDGVSWQARARTYRLWLEQGEAVVLTACVADELVGYAAVHLRSGADDDTFDFGARYAELYTLSVLPGSRGRQVGSRLLEAMDEALRERSIDTVTVAAMAGNTHALDFHRHRGFEPVEVTLLRHVPQPGGE